MANTLKFKRGLLAGLPTAAEGEPLFTTDSNDLYIGTSTGNQRFQKYIASGATTQILRGDGSLYSFPLAISSPSNGQVLKFNGTNWVNDSDAGITGSGSAGQVAYFTGATTQAGSNNLFWNNTNVRLGINTNDPLGTLHVQGSSTPLLFASAATNRVGIGTSSPNSSLEVYQNSGYTVIRSVGGAGGYFEVYNTSGVRQGSFGSESNGDTYFGTRSNTPLIYLTNGTEIARMYANGNFRVGSFISDNTHRLQVFGTSYFDNAVGIGSTSISLYSLRVSKNISGGTVAYGIVADGQIQSAVTVGTINIWSNPTVAASTTSTNLYHFRADQGTFNGSTITNQHGFYVDSSLIGATNNFGFRSEIPSGTNRWNLYMNGSASNYLAGSLGISTTSITAKLEIASVTGTTLIRATTADTNGNADVEIKSTGTLGSSRLYFSDTAALSGSIIYSHANNAFTFATAGTTKLSLDTNGSLGLGVTPSAWSSTVNGFQLGYVGAINGRPSGSGIYLSSNAYFVADPGANGAGARYIQTTVAGSYAVIGNSHYWFTAPSGTLNTAITWTIPMTLYSTGNLAIGSAASDLGQRLQVTGDAFIKGSGNTSATIGLTVQNSDGTNIFRVFNDGNAYHNVGSLFVGSLTARSSNIFYYSAGGANTNQHVFTTTSAISLTSGDTFITSNQATFAPTSGNAVFSAIRLQPTINQTGGANGITRGIYVNPGITAAADWRSIEWSNNSGWGLYGAGTSNNYVGGNFAIGSTANTTDWLNIAASTTAKAQIYLAAGTAPTAPANGDIWFDGTDLKMRIGGVTKTFTLV